MAGVPPEVPTVPPPMMGASPAPYAAQAHIPNYLVQAILTTLFCCLPVGVVSIVYAAQVTSKQAVGDVAGAQQASANAKAWAWISFGVGIGLYLLYALIMVAVALAH